MIQAPYITEAEQNGYPEGDVYLNEALDFLTKAIRGLYAVETQLGKTANELEGTPFEDRIMSIANDLENLDCDMNKIRERMERGYTE